MELWDSSLYITCLYLSDRGHERAVSPSKMVRSLQGTGEREKERDSKFDNAAARALGAVSLRRPRNMAVPSMWRLLAALLAICVFYFILF